MQMARHCHELLPGDHLAVYSCQRQSHLHGISHTIADAHFRYSFRDKPAFHLIIEKLAVQFYLGAAIRKKRPAVCWYPRPQHLISVRDHSSHQTQRVVSSRATILLLDLACYARRLLVAFTVIAQLIAEH